MTDIDLPDEDEYLENQQERGHDIIEPVERDETDEEIKPMELGEAIDYHLGVIRSEDCSPHTVDSHKTKLRNFCSWLNVIADVQQTDDIKPEHFQDFRIQRAENVKKVTVKDDMNTIRKFVRHLESRRACQRGLHDFVQAPSLSGDEGIRSDHLPIERGDKALQYCPKYLYASKPHVLFELWWAAGIRIGGIHSLDVEDVDFEEKCVDLKHRPDEGTRLKNQTDGERVVGLTDATMLALRDYLDSPDRPEVTDEHGRNPLITTQHGRASISHLRAIFYELTQPCTYGDECPIDRDPSECEWAHNRNEASKCPESKSPHALRSGALTRQLKSGIEPSYLSERANVGLETLEKHYNEMTQQEKMKVRREQFDEEFESLGQIEQEEKLFGN